MKQINKSYFPTTRTDYSLTGNRLGIAKGYAVGPSRGYGYGEGSGTGYAQEESGNPNGRELGRGFSPGRCSGPGWGYGKGDNETS